MSADRPYRQFSHPLELALYSAGPFATLVTAPLLAHLLGPTGRGFFGIATVVSQFALTLGAWGQAETYLSMAREGAFHYRQQARIALVGGITTSILTAVALVALGVPLVASILTAVWIPLLNQTSLWRSVAIADKHLKPPAIAGALAPALRVGALLALAAATKLTLDNAITATQLSLALAALLALAPSVRRVVMQQPTAPISTRSLLGRGGAVIAFDTFNAIALRSDVVILAIFATPHQVGLYAAPASLTTAALALSGSFKTRLQASAVHNASNAPLARQALPLLLLSGAGAGVLWFTAPYIVPLLFGSRFAESVPLMQLLGVAAVPLLMLDLAQGVLVVSARRRTLILVGVVSATTVLATLLVLCPLLGAQGAAIACICGYGTGASVAWGILITGAGRN
jgi:O-antigen/teichoic acid export membrane protein